MPPRHALPGDDLYARLEVPPDASAEAIELAWRGLLRRHHPDVAGPDGLELAKRINVAHDWLSDPELRRRYDRERADGDPLRSSAARGVRSARLVGHGLASGPPAADHGRAGRPRSSSVSGRSTPTSSTAWRSRRARPDRVPRDAPALRAAELDEATLERAERAAMRQPAAGSAARPATRDAVVGKLADIVLGDDPRDAAGRSGRTRALASD